MIIIPQNPTCYLIPSVSNKKRRKLWSFLQTVYQDSQCKILLCCAFPQFTTDIQREIPLDFKNKVTYYTFEKKFIISKNQIDILILDGPEFFTHAQILELTELKIPIIFLTCFSSDHFFTQGFFKKFEGFGFYHQLSQNLVLLAWHKIIKALSPPRLSFLFLKLAYVFSFGLRGLPRKRFVMFIFRSHRLVKYGKRFYVDKIGRDSSFKNTF